MTYDEVMAGVKETRKFPVAIAGTSGLLSRPEAEWLNRIPRALGPGLYAELGTFRGRSACLLMDSIQHLPGSKLVTVDLFDQRLIRGKFKYKQADLYDHVMEIFKSKGFDRYVEVVKANTSEAAALFDRSFIFLFIDADHRYEGVCSDFYTWRDKMLPGGVIAFHDSNLEGVARLHSEIKDWVEFDHVDTLSVWRRK